MSIASLVLGLVGLPLCFVLIPPVLAVIFGFVGISQIKADPTQGGRGLAIAGIVLGAVSIGLVLLLFTFGNPDITIERG